MLTVVGTIKLDDPERQAHAFNSLRSVEPIAHLLDWQFNIAGKFGEMVKKAIKNQWPGAQISTDGDTCAYRVMRGQLNSLRKETLLFYWLEDHWFVCEDPPAFLDLLEEFAGSFAEVLTVSHLTCSWEQKAWLPVHSYTRLRTEYRVDGEAQERVWAHCPGAYTAGIPMVCKRRFAIDMLEHCRSELEQTKGPGPFELPPHKARSFLESRGWLEFVPTFHVFREVFRQPRNPRAVAWDEALRIIEGRDR